MTTFTETLHQGEFLLSEADGTRSREAVTVTVSGATKWLSGQLLGRITATGKYVKYNDAATDGSQAVAGVLYNELDPVAGDVKATIIARDAEVLASALTGLDTNGRADLLALGIIVR